MIRMFAAVFRSFGYAFRGLYRTLCGERNFRIHVVAVCAVTWFSVLYEVTAMQAAVIVTLFGLVLGLEAVNTAVEHTVDLVVQTHHPLAERAKDAAAAGVLMGAVASVVAAIFLFRDPSHWLLLWDKLHAPVRVVCLILFILASLFFVRGRKQPPSNH